MDRCAPGSSDSALFNLQPCEPTPKRQRHGSNLLDRLHGVGAAISPDLRLVIVHDRKPLSCSCLQSSHSDNSFGWPRKTPQSRSSWLGLARRLTTPTYSTKVFQESPCSKMLRTDCCCFLPTRPARRKTMLLSLTHTAGSKADSPHPR